MAGRRGVPGGAQGLPPVGVVSRVGFEGFRKASIEAMGSKPRRFRIRSSYAEPELGEVSPGDIASRAQQRLRRVDRFRQRCGRHAPFLPAAIWTGCPRENNTRRAEGRRTPSRRASALPTGEPAVYQTETEWPRAARDLRRPRSGAPGSRAQSGQHAQRGGNHHANAHAAHTARHLGGAGRRRSECGRAFAQSDKSGNAEAAGLRRRGGADSRSPTRSPASTRNIPNVKVEVVDRPDHRRLGRLCDQGARPVQLRDSAADVYGTAIETFQAFSSRGLFLPLNDYVKAQHRLLGLRAEPVRAGSATRGRSITSPSAGTTS